MKPFIAVLSLLAALPLTMRGATHYESYAFETYAGIPPGKTDGAGSAARFRSPFAIASDTAGNLYVADTANHIIRKVTPTGEVTTLAGLANSFGFVNGPGAAARFNSPRGIAVDSASNVYVADWSNRVIRKITPAGVVSTFFNPDYTGINGVAVDSANNVYTAGDDQVIRKIAPNGTATIIAGMLGSSGSADGIGPAARFNFPTGVAVDSSGTIFVADDRSHTIRKITPGGVVTTLAGLAGQPGAVDGTGSATRFSRPRHVTVDTSGNVYVADTSNQLIRKVTQAGGVSTVAGLAGMIGSNDGLASAARFNLPSGIATDAAGAVYIAEVGNCTIRKLTAGVVTTVAGVASPGSDDAARLMARFRQAKSIALDGAGNLYVADTANHTIRKISADGVVTTVAGLAGNSGATDGNGSAARFSSPAAVAVDGSGFLYVADTDNHTVRKITPDGTVSTLAGFAGSHGTADGTGDYARFRSPSGITVDSGGVVFVADTRNNAIRRISPTGDVTTFAGLAPFGGQINGAGSNARFSYPTGIALDSSGNFYIADTSSHVIRKMTPGRVVTTLAGQFGGYGSADGIGTVARFWDPQSVAVDGSGNVFVADYNNDSIRKITAAGVTTTIAGAPPGGIPFGHNSGSNDGVGPAVRFTLPRGVAADAAGHVFVADTSNNSVRRGMLAPFTFVNAASRKTHGSAGAFDLPLALTNQSTVEPRSGGANSGHTLVLKFSTDVGSGTAVVTSGSGTVASAAPNGTELTVSLTNVANAQTLELTIGNLTDTLGRSLQPFAVRASFLLGDINNDRSVNSGDALLTRAGAGQSLNSANFAFDVNTDAAINSADALLVRTQAGNGLTANGADQ